MTETEAIVTAARRYCIDNFAYWSREYQERRTGSDWPYTCSDGDYDLFPRYQAMAAIREGVEYYVGKAYPTAQECKKELVLVGGISDSVFTKAMDNAIARKAIEDERRKFVQYIEELSVSDLINIEPLPYRRRLEEGERGAIRKQLKERFDYEDHWAPIVVVAQPSVFLAHECLTPKDREAVIEFLRARAQSKLFEIREDQLDYEVEFNELSLTDYETTFCDASCGWLVYSSHESTVTFGGSQLIDFVRSLFRDRETKLDQWPSYA